MSKINVDKTTLINLLDLLQEFYLIPENEKNFKEFMKRNGEESKKSNTGA